YNIWTGKNVGEEYQKAQEAGRSAVGRLVKDTPPEIAEIAHAAAIPGHDDAAAFGDLMATNDVLVDLSKSSWSLRFDPQNVGIRDKWFAPEDNTPGIPIKIGTFWEEQGMDYDGIAWYQTQFKAAPTNKKTTLVFGAVDESATVWLNGEK